MPLPTTRRPSKVQPVILGNERGPICSKKHYLNKGLSINLILSLWCNHVQESQTRHVPHSHSLSPLLSLSSWHFLARDDNLTLPPGFITRLPCEQEDWMTICRRLPHRRSYCKCNPRMNSGHLRLAYRLETLASPWIPSTELCTALSHQCT